MATSQKLAEMLSAEDIEMIQLGAQMLTSYPRRFWERILKKYVHKPFEWSITEDGITIHKRWGGLWEQLDTGYRHVYNISNFNTQSINQAIRSYLNQHNEDNINQEQGNHTINR